MIKKPVIYFVAALFFVAAVVFAPVNRERIIGVGTDDYEAHYALFGNRTKAQTIELSGELKGVGSILVNLRRAPQVAPAKVAIYDTNNNLLAEQNIPAEHIIDDTFAWADFSGINVENNQVKVVLSAPEATKQAPVGLRFEIDRPENLAVAVREQVFFWQASSYFFMQLATVYSLGSALLYGLVATLLIMTIILLPRLSFFTEKRMTTFYIIFLVIIFFLTVSVRLNVLQSLKGVSGGDAYNYLAITRQITELNNPFAGEKRLPGWPFLLVPAYLSQIDDIWWMRFLSILSAGGSVVMLAGLARALRLPWSVQVTASVLLAFQKDFFLTSLRPEPYTFYTFLLLLALWLFIKIDRPWQQWGLGGVLGYAAITRQEGLVLATVLIIGAAWLRKKLGWKGYARILAPLLLLVSPYFFYNAAAFGNPFFTPYFEGGRNKIVASWDSFQQSATASWEAVGSMWWRGWSQEIYIELNDLFFVGSGLYVLWWVMVTRRKASNYWQGKLWSVPVAGTIAAAMTILFLLSLRSVTQIQDPLLPFGQGVMRAFAGVMAAGTVAFLVFTRWRGVLIICVLLTQILIALWFHPLPKHFQQSYPLLILIMVTALFVPLNIIQQQIRQFSRQYRLTMQGITLTMQYVLLAPLIITIFVWQQQINSVIDKLNANSAVDYVIYEAVQEARRQPGPHGLDRMYQIAEVYFPDSLFYYRDDPSKEKQQVWLDALKVRTLVVTNREPTAMIREDTWQEVKHIRSEGKNERMMESWVFEIPRETK